MISRRMSFASINAWPASTLASNDIGISQSSVLCCSRKSRTCSAVGMSKLPMKAFKVGLRRLNYNRVEHRRLFDLAETQSLLRGVDLPEMLGCLFGGVKREHPSRKRRFIQCRADVHGDEGLQERNLCFRPRIFYQANKPRKCRRDLRLVVHQQRIVR